MREAVDTYYVTHCRGVRRRVHWMGWRYEHAALSEQVRMRFAKGLGDACGQVIEGQKFCHVQRRLMGTHETMRYIRTKHVRSRSVPRAAPCHLHGAPAPGATAPRARGMSCTADTGRL